MESFPNDAKVAGEKAEAAHASVPWGGSGVPAADTASAPGNERLRKLSISAHAFLNQICAKELLGSAFDAVDR